MKILNEDMIHLYSAAMEAPCGQGIMVWRDKDHRQQDQMRDHLKDCKKCHKIIQEYKSLEEVSWYLQGYVDKYMKTNDKII